MNSKPRVILYSKPGCHLCEEMKEQMRKANCDDLYDFEEVNIESDPTLMAKYRFEIPVLAINGVEAFRYRVSADDFRAFILRLIDRKPT